eukprot:m.338668 g.338668  ORF g.338668 m.338668 type:complete len:69 (+) comp18497_c0_seq1:675-881(+)
MLAPYCDFDMLLYPPPQQLSDMYPVVIDLLSSRWNMWFKKNQEVMVNSPEEAHYSLTLTYDLLLVSAR